MCEEKTEAVRPGVASTGPGLMLGLWAAVAFVWFSGLAAPERQLRAGPTQPRSLGVSQAAGNSGAV